KIFFIGPRGPKQIGAYPCFFIPALALRHRFSHILALSR
ncbi:MAG: hypothetical protein ACI9MU_002727, partial [Alphaproteobacteria bacterium]